MLVGNKCIIVNILVSVSVSVIGLGSQFYRFEYITTNTKQLTLYSRCRFLVQLNMNIHYRLIPCTPVDWLVHLSLWCPL